MVSVTVSIVSLIFVIRSAMSNGSRLLIVPLSGTVGDALGPESICTNLLPTSPSFWIDGDRVEPHQLVQIAPAPASGRGTAAGRPAGTRMACHLARRPCPTPGPWRRCRARRSARLGVHLEGVAEQHAPAADQEQADAEKKHAADRRMHRPAASRMFGISTRVLRLHERAEPSRASLRSSSAAVPRAGSPLVEHHQRRRVAARSGCCG